MHYIYHPIDFLTEKDKKYIFIIYEIEMIQWIVKHIIKLAEKEKRNDICNEEK